MSMALTFQRLARIEPDVDLTVHLWHRGADPARIVELQDVMLAHRPFRHAKLVIHEDGEQLPGAVVIEGDLSWQFDLSTFRLMVSDIL